MKKITCLAVDDEPLALDVIKTFCSRIPELELHSLNSPVEAMQHLEKNNVDLLFLDINMPEMMGLEIAASIGTLPYIIFTTAYAEYAVESYEYNTVGYLLKPYNFERFEKAVHKAMNLLIELKKESSISVKVDYRHTMIPTEKIIYIEAMGNYIKIHTTTGSYLPQMTMKDIESQLNAPHIIRIHRSYIINTKCIDSYQRREVTVKGVELPIGKSYLHVLDSIH